MTVNGASTIVSLVSQVIEKSLVLCYAQAMYWLPLQAKRKATRSLPDHENERQRSVNDFWPCRMVNQSARWPLMSIYGVLPGFIG